MLIEIVIDNQVANYYQPIHPALSEMPPIKAYYTEYQIYALPDSASIPDDAEDKPEPIDSIVVRWPRCAFHSLGLTSNLCRSRLGHYISLALSLEPPPSHTITTMSGPFFTVIFHFASFV